MTDAETPTTTGSVAVAAPPSARALPLLVLPSGVVLPQMVVTLALESDDARDAVAGSRSSGGLVLLVPKVGDSYTRVGTVARIENEGELADGLRGIVLRGTSRATVGKVVASDAPGLWVEADPIAEAPVHPERARDLVREYRAVARAIAAKLGSPRLVDLLAGIEDPGALADTAGWAPDLSLEAKVDLLETLDPIARLQKALEHARERLAELDLAERIAGKVNDDLEKTQREHLLRRQLEAIRSELGEGGGEDGSDDYRARIAERDLPEHVRTAVEREVDRLERTSEQSPEHGWIRSWLDTVLDVPWGERTPDQTDVTAARGVLDADHTGLDDVKERIVEYLAVRALRARRTRRANDSEPGTAASSEAVRSQGRRGAGAILALVGPPGVGKTSLGESVARALGRKFARVALGGVHDEAELRGHRRTYVGARPGRIVRALTEAGTMNPVIVLDEVDKLGADWRGDPSSALLEVLDPAQNHTFRDHYLEVDLDLSDVVFLATANMADTIPGPLLDRLEIIRLDGYTEDEKLAIARDHLVERQLERNGLSDGDVVVTDAAMRLVIAQYTREAGVRGLERQLGALLRKAAVRIATDDDVARPITVDETDVRESIGRPVFVAEEAGRTSTPGVATGLAVTGAGGDVLYVEATVSPGEGIVLTGQLGDVMKESAQIAWSYVRAHADALGLDTDATNRRVHVHVPAGAIPKDGPSAGVTMTTALVSLLTGRAVRPNVGMTGEVTLQGRVLGIGGVKQKVLAAQRAGLDTVILPSRNEHDLDDVPVAVREAMQFHFVSDVSEVLALALEPGTPVAAAA